MNEFYPAACRKIATQNLASCYSFWTHIVLPERHAFGLSSCSVGAQRHSANRLASTFTLARRVFKLPPTLFTPVVFPSAPQTVYWLLEISDHIVYVVSEKLPGISHLDFQPLPQKCVYQGSRNAASTGGSLSIHSRNNNH